MYSFLRLIFVFFIIIALPIEAKYLQVVCKSGDGISILLQRYQLEQTDFYYSKFKELNPKKVKKNGDLFAGIKYSLPIKIMKYNGKSIRSSLGIDNFETAVEIQNYNEKLLDKNLIKKEYKASRLLYVPMVYSSEIHESKATTTSNTTQINSEFNTKLFGKANSRIDVVDNSLQNRVFYLSPGHGGIDPGAIGTKDGKRLCEDEYAYDITLRLAKKLLEHNATVYMTVQDPNDGIREDYYLECDSDELYHGGDTISGNQTTRLLKRAEIMNDLYAKHKKTAKSQTALMIHVDSRYEEQRIDIFYYYNEDDAKGKLLANTIYQTIKEKYAQNQPGRGYYGTISTRSLLELRKTKATGVYIELGNIQNPTDQVRFIDPNNRQAIANWLYLGLLKGTK